MDLDGKSKQDLISARQSLGDENSDDENELNPLGTHIHRLRLFKGLLVTSPDNSF